MASRTPTVLTPLPKSSPAPNTPFVKDLIAASATTPSPEQQQEQHPVPFPPPQTFDILPPLHGLLLRLLAPQTNNEGVSNGVRPTDDPAGPTSSAAGPGQSQSQSQQQQPTPHPQQPPSTANENNAAGLPTVSSAAPGSASAAAEIAALSSNAPPPLDVKNLPTEASSIKIRIQKAHAVVESLPDVHRSVSEQETEIRELEDRIARLKSVISDFGRRADSGSSEMHAIQAS
ncbi:hypothetical protein FE257_002334 [Aspergillus nanangensis]|uniref:Mediator of RNA polymerase II transcription subunit 9 n=1 Tax=Aspergillus nanangensis TaxID=2582783 RepID=A0AAD4CCP7_ASPNN|nr:hypothetical protein FE257_002334 [Aspergillus nanangensis]